MCKEGEKTSNQKVKTVQKSWEETECISAQTMPWIFFYLKHCVSYQIGKLVSSLYIDPKTAS